MRVEESVEIRRGPEEVWAFVEDHGNDTEWCRKVKSVEPVSAERWNVMHKPVPLRPAVPLALERLTADPPRRLTMRQDDEASTFNVEYRLEAIPDGTRFTQISNFEWKKLPKLLHKTFARGVRRDIQGQLRGLKRVLEA
jgi:carbon monoxide dehydrogenase subunit G